MFITLVDYYYQFCFSISYTNSKQQVIYFSVAAYNKKLITKNNKNFVITNNNTG